MDITYLRLGKAWFSLGLCASLCMLGGISMVLKSRSPEKLVNFLEYFAHMKYAWFDEIKR